MENPVEPTAELLWSDVSARLHEMLNETTYATWFGDARGGELEDDTFSLVVPNDFTREWIEANFLGFLKGAVRDALGRDVRVAIAVREPDAVPGEVVEQPAPVRATEGRPSRRRTRSTRSTCS